MNSTDHTSSPGHDTAGNALESRLRHDLEGIAASTTTAAPGRFDPDRRSITADPSRPVRRNSTYLVAAAAVGALTVGGAVALSARSASEPAASSPPPASATLPALPPQRVDPCSEDSCSDFDPLPVAPGAADYYVGPADLGEPVIATEYFDQLTRCTELSNDFTTCNRIEGIAGVAPVGHLPDGDVTATSDPANGFDSTDDASVQVGTTFTEVSPLEYAASWGQPQGDGPLDQTTVRGHAAIRYLNNASPALVWQERSGVLVWVAVPPAREGELAGIAENIQRVDGPTTIPYRAMVPDFATAWDTGDNNGNGLIFARSSGIECVGLDYVEICGVDLVDRTIIRKHSEGATRVAGSTPPDVTTVRVGTADGTSTDVETVAFADASSRFYSASIDAALGEVVDVAWLAADGSPVASMPNPKVAQPDVAIGSGDDPTFTTCTVPGACGSYVVREGDDPALVAAKFCVTAGELFAANGGGGFDTFGEPGSTIQIPPDQGRTVCPDAAEPFPATITSTTAAPSAQ